MCAMMKRPVLVFFKEMVPGDVEKYYKKSNIKKTGGGARDLRFPKAFGQKIASMFPKPGTEPGILNAEVHWVNEEDGSEGKAFIKLWRPTSSRDTEARIGRFYNVGSWAVNIDEYKVARSKGEKWFYLLVLDANGNLWARQIRESNLSGETPMVRDFVKKRINETRRTHSVNGVINFDKGEVYPK
jgi:hypothetical protein